MKHLKTATATVTVAGIATAVLIVAAAPALAGTAGHVLTAASSLNQVITNITKWLVGLLVGLATLLLTVGGVRYLLAGGDPGEVQRAKNTLKYSAIGYGVAVLAPLLVTILKGFVGG
jgi:Type IV secretion system pilin